MNIPIKTIITPDSRLIPCMILLLKRWRNTHEMPLLNSTHQLAEPSVISDTKIIASWLLECIL